MRVTFLAGWTIALSKRVLPSAHVDDNKDQTPSPLIVATGRQLAAERVAAGLSLRQLSAKSGVSVESLTRYEHAKRVIPLEVLGKIADALGIRPSAIVLAAEDRVEREAAAADALSNEA
jgi:ribosome-binding protein aMBF1 (putative translation factor)